MREVCIQYGGGVHTVWGGVHTVWGRCTYSMGEVCIQYGGGVHTVWGRCVYSMGEVCIQYGGGVHTVWGRCTYSMGEVYIQYGEVCIQVCIQYGGGVHTVWGRCAYSVEHGRPQGWGQGGGGGGAMAPSFGYQWCPPPPPLLPPTFNKNSLNYLTSSPLLCHMRTMASKQKWNGAESRKSKRQRKLLRSAGATESITTFFARTACSAVSTSEGLLVLRYLIDSDLIDSDWFNCIFVYKGCRTLVTTGTPAESKSLTVPDTCTRQPALLSDYVSVDRADRLEIIQGIYMYIYA